MAVPQEVMFQNQLLFNLNVPLTTHNITTHFHRPRPITIERTTSHPAPNQGFPLAQLASRDSGRPTNGHPSDGVQFPFSVLSQDRMAAAVQMAKRDLKNQKLTNQQEQSRERSPSPTAAKQKQKLIYGTKQWEHRRSRTLKKPSTAVPGRVNKTGLKEHDKNRKPRNAGSQTPPSSSPPSPPRQVFLNTKLSPERQRSDSPPTRDTPSLTVCQQPADDIERLQLEMELCLQQIQAVQKRALSEHSTDFLRRNHSSSRDQHRECLWLKEAEAEGRRQAWAREQAHRTLRTIYNLRQQLKEVERQALKLPRDCRATKKSLASKRLLMINRGVVKLLQNFVAQLPYQDLRNGLPSHFSELAVLVRKVTLLSAGVTGPLPPHSAPQYAGKARESTHKAKAASSQLSAIEADVMAMVDQVEKLNCDWRRDFLSRETSPPPPSHKPPFVTNFKTTKLAFMKELVNQSELNNRLYKERKALLQKSLKTFLKTISGSRGAGGQKPQKKKAAFWVGKEEGRAKVNPYSIKLALPPPPPRSRGVSKKVSSKKLPPYRKRSVLPAKARIQHRVAEQHQPSQVTSLSSTHFADPTITANLKASTMLHNPFMTHRTRSEPPSPRDRRKVNFIPPYAAGRSHHASYPGTSCNHTRTFQRSLTPPTHLSRSYSPRVHFSCSSEHGHGPPQVHACHSDSEYSLTGGGFTSRHESSPSPASSVESFPGRSGPHSRKQASHHRQGPGCPSAKRRQFFIADADPELVGELFPEDSRTTKTRNGGKRRQTNRSRKEEASLAPYMKDVERRVKEKLVQLTRDRCSAEHSYGDQGYIDRVADAILEEAIMEVTEEMTDMERKAAASEVAAAHLDSPTLHNILQALDNMQKENDRLRQKYCSVTFHDSVLTRRRYQKPSEVYAEFRSDQPHDPLAFEVRNTRPAAQQRENLPREFPSELTQEPLIFTKEDKAYRPNITFTEKCEADHLPRPIPLQPRAVPSALRSKILLSMKQTVVERIADGVERFDYFQRGLKHHLGKHMPFQLYERVADNILWQCCSEVAQELESINADMAENIYTSEFLSDTGLPLAPPELADDFFRANGTAAQNLRDSAAAQRTVEEAVSKTVISLMLPPDEADLSVISPRPVIDTEGEEGSPRWDTSLKHVYDATALYEASITADRPAASVDVSPGKAAVSVDMSQEKAAVSAVKEDDTHMQEYDYDDDYTDISDDEYDEDNDSDDRSGSPSPSSEC